VTKTFVFRGILACLLALAAFAASAEETGAATVDTAWAKAMKAGDLDAVVACYAEDAVLWLPGAPEARGSKAIRETYAGMLAANTVTEASIMNAHYETRQNISVGWGNFVLALQPKAGGAPAVMHGRFTDVARQVKGRWHYVADQASADPAPAPAAAKP
jgi:uncharacterized protein (TIGR02246 family)